MLDPDPAKYFGPEWIRMRNLTETKSMFCRNRLNFKYSYKTRPFALNSFLSLNNYFDEIKKMRFRKQIVFTWPVLPFPRSPSPAPCPGPGTPSPGTWSLCSLPPPVICIASTSGMHNSIHNRNVDIAPSLLHISTTHIYIQY